MSNGIHVNSFKWKYRFTVLEVSHLSTWSDSKSLIEIRNKFIVKAFRTGLFKNFHVLWHKYKNFACAVTYSWIWIFGISESYEEQNTSGILWKYSLKSFVETVGSWTIHSTTKCYANEKLLEKFKVIDEFSRLSDLGRIQSKHGKGFKF